MNFISCVKWVRQGAGKTVPDVISLNEEELKELVTDADQEDRACKSENVPDAHCSDEYDFANYDNEEAASRAKIKDIVSFGDKQEQKSMRKKKKQQKNVDEDSDEEDELIKENDNLILVGHVDDDFNSINVYIYNEDDGDMYIHHDIILESAPLCIEWLSANETCYTNFCAVGEMNPVIGIWDLDIVNCIEPVFKLGRAKKKDPSKNFGHTDAVLTLAWNTELPHILCSGSVDKRGLLWDLDSGKVATELSVFEDKLQTVSWNPLNPYSLLTGCADGYLRNFDCRLYNNFQAWKLNSGIECLLCHPGNEFCCFAGTEDGEIHCIDYRKKKPIFSFQAHSKEVTGIGMDINQSNTLISISADENVRLWNLDDECKMIFSKNLKLGSLYCIDMNPNYPFLACIGGSHENRNKKIMKVLNINDELQCQNNSVKYENHASDICSDSTFEIPLLENNESKKDDSASKKKRKHKNLDHKFKNKKLKKKNNEKIKRKNTKCL